MISLLVVVLVTYNGEVRLWLLFALLREAHCAEVKALSVSSQDVINKERSLYNSGALLFGATL